MATWITHTAIADRLLGRGLDFDQRGFYVGNIAPDCNVENEDWTDFVPPKKVTHWMDGDSKLTADYESFYEQYIHNGKISSKEEYSFLFGYYAHLVTDVEFMRFVRNEQRVKNSFGRIKENKILRDKIDSYPENFDTLKKVFGRDRVFRDIAVLEKEYLQRNKNSGYLKILREVKEFPDYLDFFPSGAIPRKIAIMADIPEEKRAEEGFVFFSEKEYLDFISNTEEKIHDMIMRKVRLKK